MNNIFISAVFCFVLVESAQADSTKLTEAQAQEMMAIVTNINHLTPGYQSTVGEKMLAEANYFSDRLRLPTPHPIQIADLEDVRVSPPWFSIIKGTNPPYLPDTIFGINICNTNIPREQRLRALKIVVRGTIETTNFFFSFLGGRLSMVERMSEPEVERYANNLDELVGKPSLIDTNGAYQLATQWLAAVNVDVPALERRFPHSVNQLHYLPHAATNAVVLPLYYVDFGLKPIHRESPVEVEILGTTKELQELTVNDPSFSRRPLLLITNALDLIRMSNPPVRQLQSMPSVQTNSALP